MPQKPSLLYWLRCFQLAFALAFLIDICYAGAHRGWWNNITGAIALGVITDLITLAIICHAMLTQFRSNPFSARGNVYQIGRLVVEVLAFLLWIATVVVMLQHKGGCDGDFHQPAVDGAPDRCYYKGVNKDFKAWDDRPLTQWIIGLAFAGVSIISFIFSIFLVFKDNRTNKLGDGPGYA